MRFDELELQQPILRAVEEMGFEEMTPIQTQAIPIVMEGRDIVGQAQTGTGKKFFQSMEDRIFQDRFEH